MKTIVTAFVLALTAWLAAPALAQQVEITAPAPERAPERLIVPPGDQYEAGRPSDSDYYPRGPRVRHDPAYIAPLSTPTAGGTGRAGVAGWTAPNTPMGSEQTGFRDVTGWFALGFAVEWGGPRPATAPTKRPAAR